MQRAVVPLKSERHLRGAVVQATADSGDDGGARRPLLGEPLGSVPPAGAEDGVLRVRRDLVNLVRAAYELVEEPQRRVSPPRGSRGSRAWPPDPGRRTCGRPRTRAT